MFGTFCQFPASKEEEHFEMFQKLLGHQRIPKKQEN
jgi:hypothetical protein